MGNGINDPRRKKKEKRIFFAEIAKPKNRKTEKIVITTLAPGHPEPRG
jgi:hypothetical protein